MPSMMKSRIGALKFEELYVRYTEFGILSGRCILISEMNRRLYLCIVSYGVAGFVLIIELLYSIEPFFCVVNESRGWIISCTCLQRSVFL
jgi:hypothetical protein